MALRAGPATTARLISKTGSTKSHGTTLRRTKARRRSLELTRICGWAVPRATDSCTRNDPYLARSVCWAERSRPPSTNSERLSLWDRRHRTGITLGIEAFLVPLEILFGRHFTGPDFFYLLDQVGLTLRRPERPRGVPVIALGKSIIQCRQNLGQPRVDIGQVLTCEINRRWNHTALHQESRLHFWAVVVVEERRGFFRVL